MVGTVLQDPEPKMDVSELEKQLLRIAEGGEGNIETLLSEEGVNINVTNEFRETPLHRASWHGNEEIVKALLKHKADINIQDVDGWTPLYNAAMTDRVSIRPARITRKPIKVDIPDQYGRTPLHIASEYGYQDIVAGIVRYKTDLDEKDPEKSLDKTDNSGRTALYLAAAGGHARVVKEIASTGTSKIETALLVASEYGHREVVQVLLQCGANVMARNANGRDEIPLAARSGFTEVIEELLDTRHEWSLARTAGEGNKVKSLAQKSSNKTSDRESVQEEIRATTRDGDTALHLAAASGHEETVKKLLEKVDEQTREAVNQRGETALHIAAKSGFARVVRSLIGNTTVNKATGKGNTALHLAAASGHTEVVVEILKNSSELPSSKNEAGDMALHLAAMNGHTEVIVKLLDVKNISEMIAAKNKAGDMALHLATANGYPEIVDKLLHVMKGSEVATSKNKAGHTVLSKAIEAGQWEIAKMILEKILKTKKPVDLGILDFDKALIFGCPSKRIS